MADFPHLKASGRRAIMRRLWAAAGLGDLPGDGTHDDEGRLILRGKEAIVGWFRAWGLVQ